MFNIELRSYFLDNLQGTAKQDLLQHGMKDLAMAIMLVGEVKVTMI